MAKKKIMMFLNVLIGLILLLALISVATLTFFDFNLLATISFNIRTIELILAGFVGIVGLIGLIALVIQSVTKVIRVTR